MEIWWNNDEYILVSQMGTNLAYYSYLVKQEFFKFDKIFNFFIQFIIFNQLK